MIDFKLIKINFPSHSGSPAYQEKVALFQSDVNKANVAINGYRIGFTNGDRELFRQEIDASIKQITGNVVTIAVTYALRDKSGAFDDPFDGSVDLLVIVDRD